MYDANTQLLYLSVFLAKPDLYTKMKRVHKPEYYSPTIRKAVTYIDEYYEEFSSLPDHLMIKAKSNIEVPSIPQVDHGIESWFTQEYPKFSLHKSLELALYKADEEVQNQNYDAMESIINEAYDVRLAFDYGIVYNEDPEERLRNILERSGNMSSGFQGIDGTVGKPNSGDLVIYAGPSGSGKSLFLQNHAINHWKSGLNVLKITLELHPELVSRRMDCMLLNKSVADLYSDLRATAMEISMFSKKHNVGDMRIKYMPSGSSTADIKNLVKMYMNDTKKKVDVLIVDYMDLLNPVAKFSMGDTFTKDKMVSEELRNIGQELGPLVITASQLNRSAVGLDDLDHSNIAGGLSKINTADLVFGIITSTAMRERGEYELQVLKSRNSSGTGRKIPMLINEHSMRIYDDPDYISKLSAYMSMPTNKANEDRHENDVSKTYNELQDAISKANTAQSGAPATSPTGTVGSVYGGSTDTSTDTTPENDSAPSSVDDPLQTYTSGQHEDDERFGNIMTLINKTKR